MPYLQRFMPEMESRVRGIGRGRRGFGEVLDAEEVLLREPVPVELGEGATTIWGAKGAAITAAEIATMESAMNGFNYFAAAVTAPQLNEKVIMDGAIRFALKHVILSQGKLAYSSDSGLQVTTKPTTIVYLPIDLWRVKEQAAIGVVRYFMNTTNWNDWEKIITTQYPSDWWTRYATAIFNYLSVYGWLPAQWW